MTLRPTRFELLELTLLDLGALRGQRSFRFRNEEGEPTNVFMIMGTNGAGKTTVLEAIYAGMRLLDAREHDSTGIDDIDRKSGGLQLDARVALDDGSRSKLYLLSISVGRPGLLKRWTDEELAQAGVERQIVLSFRSRISGPGLERSAESDPEAVAFAEAILERAGEPPAALFDVANGYPSVLYFPSDRGIRRPPDEARAITRPAGLYYRAAHRFDADGQSWDASIDNLFVWFAWLNDGREEECRELVNRLVFRGVKRLGAVDRPSLSVPVEVESGTHRIDQLSSGERQLVQLIVRIASHVTGSTIVLIDETEQHLHLVMRRRLINIIKQWACEHQGISFVMTSHQVDSLRVFAPKLHESGLVKGGALLKPKMKV
ncbi:AAA family ATPase [Pseudomonas aeruginosa]|uniref:AAA family ATPase n=2 Tax=Pseudomonas aeruginosa TaxID=287 RepID=UPI001374E0D8|nr:AAA family ATPase [Pseudomonas aeruginosa]MBT9308150.1 ATP-binding protein [Pseudomonas aeruginosa]MCF8573000.1 ATP-binding protein [Pseudomonas aeruginosa]MCG7138740.1 ATP-binding protein [Pseudomonas aeruginosa]MCG7145090.1 ATP-binding protein [Pseudomonas aeruginosa]MDI2410226.1 ATP-binding protein [Pseudomonas aeruginosa]